LERDFNQREGAHEEWTAAGVSDQVLLYTILFPLYSLLQLFDQDCCFSNNVLCTADVLVMIPGVEETLSKLYWKPEALKLFSAETIIYHYDTIISLITTISSIITK